MPTHSSCLQTYTNLYPCCPPNITVFKASYVTVPAYIRFVLPNSNFGKLTLCFPLFLRVCKEKRSGSLRRDVGIY